MMHALILLQRHTQMTVFDTVPVCHLHGAVEVRSGVGGGHPDVSSHCEVCVRYYLTGTQAPHRLTTNHQNQDTYNNVEKHPYILENFSLPIVTEKPTFKFS